jgi:hypothetical protein
MYFDQYVLFDKEHHIDVDNQQKTKVMVLNQVNLLDYLKRKKEKKIFEKQKSLFTYLVCQ